MSRANHQPIDRNPSVSCEDCGDSYAARDYWAGRWQMGNPNDASAVCDECLARCDRMHDRLVNNRQLDSFIDPRDTEATDE